MSAHTKTSHPNQNSTHAWLESLDHSQLVDMLAAIANTGGNTAPTAASPPCAIDTDCAMGPASADESVYSRRLFVRQLAFFTNNESLRSFFSQYGPIEEATVKYERDGVKSKGFGFVTFKSARDAQAALIEPLKTIDGRVTQSFLAIDGQLKARPQNARTTKQAMELGIAIPAEVQPNFNVNFNNTPPIQPVPHGPTSFSMPTSTSASPIKATMNTSTGTISPPTAHIAEFVESRARQLAQHHIQQHNMMMHGFHSANGTMPHPNFMLGAPSAMPNTQQPAYFPMHLRNNVRNHESTNMSMADRVGAAPFVSRAPTPPTAPLFAPITSPSPQPGDMMQWGFMLPPPAIVPFNLNVNNGAHVVAPQQPIAQVAPIEPGGSSHASEDIDFAKLLAGVSMSDIESRHLADMISPAPSPLLDQPRDTKSLFEPFQYSLSMDLYPTQPSTQPIMHRDTSMHTASFSFNGMAMTPTRPSRTLDTYSPMQFTDTLTGRLLTTSATPPTSPPPKLHVFDMMDTSMGGSATQATTSAGNTPTRLMPDTSVCIARPTAVKKLMF